jgi:hypothetical protein
MRCAACSAQRKHHFVYCCVIAGTCFEVTVLAWSKYATIGILYKFKVGLLIYVKSVLCIFSDILLDALQFVGDMWIHKAF